MNTLSLSRLLSRVFAAFAVMLELLKGIITETSQAWARPCAVRTSSSDPNWRNNAGIQSLSTVEHGALRPAPDTIDMTNVKTVNFGLLRTR